MWDRNAQGTFGQRLTRTGQAVQDPRRRQRCPTRACRGRVALDLVVQAGLGKEGHSDHQCVLGRWPCDEHSVAPLSSDDKLDGSAGLSISDLEDRRRDHHNQSALRSA